MVSSKSFPLLLDDQKELEDVMSNQTGVLIDFTWGRRDVFSWRRETTGGPKALKMGVDAMTLIRYVRRKWLIWKKAQRGSKRLVFRE